ncbi:MAG: ACT domain-containing protein, partial [Acidobacteria bacterium]
MSRAHPSPPHPTTPSSRSAPRAGLALEVTGGELAICRLAPGRVPRWAFRGDFIAITRTPDELSVVCDAKSVPKRIRAEHGWRAIRVVGPLDLSLIGVLASIAVPLAEAGIGLFSISTYDTDYVLVRAAALDQAVAALTAAGHRFDVPPE